MALLFKSETDRADLWRSAFAKADPKLDFRQWPDVGDPGDIDFALVWHPIKGDLKRYPNLKAIFSLGAGIEHIFSDPELPKHIPVVRMVDHGLTKGMTEYVLFHVLRFHRRVPEIEAQHRAGVWKNIDCPAAWERRVGVMIRYKLTLEYDGRPFVGWQRQANGASVQAALEEAVLRFCGENVTAIAAGRTDAGVHGFGPEEDARTPASARAAQ